MTRLPFLAIALTLALPASAQDLDTPSLSPGAQVTQTVGVAEITVSYSSPGKRDRTVWGELVPWDEMWRTGANSATTLETSHDLTIGGEAVPAGKYALFTIPGEKAWTVIVNGNPDQGGTRNYDKKLDQARFTAEPSKGADRERLTFVFANTTATGADLELIWAGTKVVLPIAVDTDAIVGASIDDYLDSAAGNLTSGARYLLEKGEHERALELVEAATSIDKSWFNTWIKAEILHEQEEHKAARKAALTAQKMGNEAENFFWKERVEKALAEWPKK